MPGFSYVVISPEGKPIMSTEYKQYRYPPKVEAQMLEAGYKIQLNGKRITKKEVAELLGKKKTK